MTLPSSSPPPATDPSPRTAGGSKSLRAHHTQLTQQLDAYYDRTSLLAVVESFVRALTQRFATSRLVPLNPYAALLSHVRQAEIHALELLVAPRPRDLETLASQAVLLFDPRDGRPAVALDHQIATCKTISTVPVPALAVWGRRSVVERIPYSSEWQAGADAVNALVAPWLRESEVTDESCGVVSVGAVVGASVFFLGASQYQQAALFVELERHIIVCGDQLELAMAVFARQQIRILFEATKKHVTIQLPDGGQLSLVGPCAMVVSSHVDGSGRDRATAGDNSTWTLDRVTANRQGFATAVKMALVASGSCTLDLLYERRAGGPADNDYSFVRCQLAFFFHFDGSQPPPPPQTTPAAATKPPRAQSRSFVDLSRVERSGIFWSPRAANEISRRILEQRERETNETLMRGACGPTRLPGQSLLSELVACVGQLTRTSAEERHWHRLVPSTIAFRLVQITSLLQLMIQTLQKAVSPSNLSRLITSSVSTYHEAIGQLLQDAAVDRSSSLLHGLRGILIELCSLPEEIVDPESVDGLYQSLQRSHDTIAWLAGAAVRDFCQLMQHTTTTNAEQEELDGMAMADLRADISAAVEQRRFPPAIVAECVFAQYMVDTRLDVALERALVNTVASGLPPNPFVSLCVHLRAFASLFRSASERDSGTLDSSTSEPAIRSVGSCLFAMDVTSVQPRVAATLVAANERVLRYINANRVLVIHENLSASQVYRTAAYHPSKATYSVRVVASLVVDDPLLAAGPESPDGILLFQSVQVVEHVVIEGKELVQALQFFADAVWRDVTRLLERAPVELQLVGPSGDLVTTVELHDLQTFQQLVVEATPKQCALQIIFPPVVRVDQPHTEPIVRLVTKTYIFRHNPTEPATDGLGGAASVSDAFRRRLWAFGVGFDVEAAQFAWDLTQIPSTDEADWTALTQYAPRALQRSDTLLLHHIARIASSPPGIRPQASSRLLRLLDMDRALEWLLHRLVFQQQTNLTPRSEAASLVADAKTLLIRVASSVETLVVPLAEAMGMVSARHVTEAIASVRTFCSDATTSSDSDQIVITAERLTRQLWTLVLLVRFSLQADS